MAPELQGKTLCLLDLDGTVYLGDRVLPGAREFIRTTRERMEVVFLTNNTSRTPEQYAQKLTGLGIPTEPEQVISPLHQLLREVQTAGYKRVHTLANSAVLAWLEQRVPQVHWNSAEGAELLVLAYDDTLDYAKICGAARLLQARIPWWCTHPDLVCPAPGGPLPDCGSFAAMLSSATGSTPSRTLGKPDPGIAAPLLERHGAAACVFIGDRLYTDWELAKAAGMDFVLVFTGETTPLMWKAAVGGPGQVCGGLDSLLG